MPDIDNDGRIHKKVKNKELYKLIVSDILEVKYKDTKKYDLNNLNINGIDYWVSYFHESHYGFCYYEINNGLIGIIYKDEENNYNGLKLIYNFENDIIYEIINNENEDKINSYKKKNCPENLKEKFDEFIKYHEKIKQNEKKEVKLVNNFNDKYIQKKEVNKNNFIITKTNSKIIK